MSTARKFHDNERYTYDYFFLEYVCRLCWSANGILDLSSYNPKSIENNATIAEKIQECIGIDVISKSHPKKICSKCLNELEILTEFKRFCQETDRKLHIILQKGPCLQQNLIKDEGNNISESLVLKKKTLKHDNLGLDESSDLFDKSLTLKKEQHFEDIHLKAENSVNIFDEPLQLKDESNIDISNLEFDNPIDDLFDKLPLATIKKNIKNKPFRRERKKSITYCKFCHLNFESIQEITEHNFEYHGIEKNGLFKCFGCEKRFQNIKKRLRHETEICKKLQLGYKCNICNRYLPKRRIYERHMKEHRENNETKLLNNTYSCKKCDKIFENTDFLRDHMFLHYEDVLKKKEKKTFICDICGKVFNRQDYLYKHKLIHEGSKLHKCPHCVYQAIQKSSLTVHMRKHTGEKPYACDLCPIRCITSSNLRSHRRRHLGVKSYECKLCDKKFGYKLSLEEHMSSVHERSEKHTCTQCGSTYARFGSLRRHLLVKHGKKVKKVKEDLVEVDIEKKTLNEELVLQDERVDTVRNVDGAFME